MASIKLIKRRIKSAQNIAQITRAMEMVAASKMKKAQAAALQNKAYADRIYEATNELGKRSREVAHPLLKKSIKGKSLIILVSTNKGLCGSLNTNLFRDITNWFSYKDQTEFISVGKKGADFIVKTGKKLVADFSDKIPFLLSVPPITQFLVSGFIQGIYKDVYLCYNSFINALRQMPLKRQILPLSPFEQTDKETAKETQKFTEFVFEPSVSTLLSSLIPHYLENQIRTAIFEAEASEHSARMIAMKNATEAASDLMDDLTLIFNKIRQEKITYEIADTVTARMAIEL